MAPKSIELLRLGILCQTPAPEILNREHGGQTRAVMLGCHKNPPARRPVIRLMDGPDVRAGFGGIHAAILSEGGQLRPDIARGTIIADLENRMLQRVIRELHVKRSVQALNPGAGRKYDRQQLFKAAALP